MPKAILGRIGKPPSLPEVTMLPITHVVSLRGANPNSAAVRAQHIESAALPEERQACWNTSRFDMHFMHVSILDMQIACPDMTLVMS